MKSILEEKIYEENRDSSYLMFCYRFQESIVLKKKKLLRKLCVHFWRCIFTLLGIENPLILEYFGSNNKDRDR